MIHKINESINFLLTEYKRLKLKEEDKTITKEEKEALQKLAYFLSRSDE